MSARNVVLIHGLARGAASLWLAGRALARRGWVVHPLRYPSTRAPLEELVAHLRALLARCVGPVDFVTHSMGGILLRAFLTQERPGELGRSVMLAPPNGGSELADLLGGVALYRWINGPAGMQLGTDPGSFVRNLPPVDYPVGVIAGSRTANPLLSHFLPRPNDGKVSVASTHVQGETDHLTLPVTHTYMMNNPKVIRQIAYFLEHGRFSR